MREPHRPATAQVPAQWHHQDILAAVRKRGSSLTALARTHGFPRTTMLRATRERFPAAHRAIAEFLGVAPQQIWPQFYDADGRPVGRCRPDVVARLSALRAARIAEAA